MGRYGIQIYRLNDNMAALFSILNGNISKILRAKVKSKQGYIEGETKKNTVWLLNQ